MGFRILFIECVCEDQELLERNIIEILRYSEDYKSMSEEQAVDDLRKKLEHYMRQYEPIDASLETISFVRVENMGETVTAHKVAGQKESGILGYLSGLRPLPQTLYFTRVRILNYCVIAETTIIQIAPCIAQSWLRYRLIGIDKHVFRFD